MTHAEWKDKKVSQFLEILAEKGHTLPKEIAENWVTENGFNSSNAADIYLRIYG